MAANAYRRAVIPYNKTLDKLQAAYKNKTSLKSLRTYCAKLADNTRTWVKLLQKITWPTDTAADAKLLIRAVAAEEADLRGCAKAANSLGWIRQWNLFLKAGDRAVEAANLVRLDLGLKPVPG